MNRDEKAAVIDQIAEQIEGSQAVLAVDYRGISVPQIADLRARLGEADATFRIVKNRLTIRAADKAGAESLKELLEGPTAFTFVHGDTALAAKAIATIRREHEVLEFKGGTMEGEAVTVEELQALARLPGRDALNAQLAGMVASPLTGLVRGLGSLISGLAIQLKQIEEQELVEGEAPAEDAPAAPEQAPEQAEPAEQEAPAEEPPAETPAETSEDSESDNEAPSEGDEEKEG